MILPVLAVAAQPEVRPIRRSATDPAVRHVTYAGREITLKATTNVAGPQFVARWDFGDGSASAASPLGNTGIVAAAHQYSGAPGDTFDATLTVTDTASGETGSAVYPVVMREKSLDTEVDVAIDEGLWQLYQAVRTSRHDARSTALAVLAFERNGRLESGDPADPYTQLVADGLRLLAASRSADSWTLRAIHAAGAPNARTASGRTYRQLLDTLHVSAQSTDSAALSPEEMLLALAEQGIGQTDSRWTSLATRIRDANNFDVETKRLLALSEALQTGNAESIRYLPSAAGLGDFDWYAADRSQGDTADGVARIILSRNPRTSVGDIAASILSISLKPRDVPPSSVNNVNSKVSVTKTALVFNRLSGTYNTTVTITNTSGSSIPGPLTLGLASLTATVTLANGNGTFNGDPYVTIQAGALAASTSASVALRFNNPLKGPVNFTSTVYSGTFPPGALQLTCPGSSAPKGSSYSSDLVAAGAVQPYTYSISSGSLPHNLSLNSATGAITGTPDVVANSSFTARVDDATGGTAQFATASCSIDVTGSNQAPVASAQSAGTNQDTALALTLSGADADGDALTFSIATGPSHGTLGSFSGLSCSGTPSTCTVNVTYTPTASYSGSDSFTFKVNDGTVDSTSATVSLTVHLVQTGSFADTTQSDFQAGTPTNVSLTASAGDVVLAGGLGINQQNTTVGASGVGITVTTWGGQTFTPSISGTLSKVDINLFCSGCTGTTPNLTLSLRAVSGGLPTGADLATATITGFSGNTAAYYTATFSSPPSLSSGTQYALVVHPTANPSPGTYALTRSGTSTGGSDVYAGGTRVAGATSGTVWSIPLTGGVSTDAGFKIYLNAPYSTSGDLISSTKDSSPGVGTTTWNTLSWTNTTPTNTSIQFQVAASNSPSGPFTFVGPDTTSATYFTTSGASLSQFNGYRYLQYRAYLATTDTAATPTLSDVTVSYSVIQ